jgi:hypothetical protein
LSHPSSWKRNALLILGLAAPLGDEQRLLIARNQHSNVDFETHLN